jgi:hypothetical protein
MRLPEIGIIGIKPKGIEEYSEFIDHKLTGEPS